VGTPIRPRTATAPTRPGRRRAAGRPVPHRGRDRGTRRPSDRAQPPPTSGRR